jgi:Fur family ferric uptake transcriptional regulator
MENITITSELLELKCKEKGLRMTGLRRSMLAVLTEAMELLTVMDIFDKVIEKSMHANLPSIYRNILVLESIGIVKSHSFKAHQKYYDVSGSIKDHFVDLHTGKIIELRHSALELFKTAVASEYGYRKEDCRIEFYAYPNEMTSTSLEQDT